METFDAGWLSLREPVDHAARPHDLARRLNDWWAIRRVEEPVLRVLDLGSGSGSNLRYLAPLLDADQHWTLVDHDPALLTRASTPNSRVSVERVAADLAKEGLDLIENVDLVTASALLDLVSEDWLHVVADRCRAENCAALFALSYDGSIEWSAGQGPPDSTAPGPDPPGATIGSLDARVRDAVNAHQRQDKGLGVALGPDAATFAQRCFEERGYRTWRRPSPWQVGAAEHTLAEQLVQGWVGVAASSGTGLEVERAGRPAHPGDVPWSDQVADWAQRRLDALRSGSLRLIVGHQDVLALPPQSTAQAR